MNNKVVAGAAAGVVALFVGAWALRDSALAARAAQAVAGAGPSTGGTLAAAGVHKCRSARGILYLDRPCPGGSTELDARGGSVTVMSFPKPAPPPSALASGVLGGRLVEGLGAEERDRLRDRQIDDAANRP